MSRRLSVALLASLAALLASGVALGVSKYLLPHDDPFSHAGSAWEPWALSAHVLTAPLFVFVLGVVVRGHVAARLGDPGAARRRSGVVLLCSAGILVASGYALQVVSSERARALLAATHTLFGLAIASAFAVHARRATRRQRQRGASPDAAHPGHRTTPATTILAPGATRTALTP